MATQTSLLGLTKPDYSEVQDVGVINENMEIIDKEMGKRSRVYNLLDNSDFEIAQAGYGGKHGTVIYAADRWPQNDSTARTYSKVIHNGHGALQCTSATRIQQKFAIAEGEDYTAAVIINGTLYILNFNADGAGHEHSSGQLYLNYINANTYMFVLPNLAANAVVSEPVVYRGTYTAETLPSYVQKGYAAELLECQRHFRTYDLDVNDALALGVVRTATSIRAFLMFGTPMRKIDGKPTLTLTGVLKGFSSEANIDSVFSGTPTVQTSLKDTEGNIVGLQLSFAYSNSAVGMGQSILIIASTKAVLSISEDL